MVLQDGAGAGVGDGAFEHALDGLGFAFVGNHVDDDLALEDLGDAHAESMGGHSVEGGEPAFAQLLTAAGVVEFDHEESLVGVKVSRGIVESDVTVFADADESDINGVFGHNFLHFGAESGGIFGVAVDKENFLELAGQLVDEVLFEVEAETGLVSGGEADVLIQVEEGNFGPVDTGFLNQEAHHFKLAGSGGGNHVDAAFFGDDFAENLCAVSGSGLAHLCLVLEDFDVHFDTFLCRVSKNTAENISDGL